MVKIKKTFLAILLLLAATKTCAADRPAGQQNAVITGKTLKHAADRAMREERRARANLEADDADIKSVYRYVAASLNYSEAKLALSWYRSSNGRVSPEVCRVAAEISTNFFRGLCCCFSRRR